MGAAALAPPRSRRHRHADDHREAVMDTKVQDLKAVVEEARKTKETADRLANGDYPEDADHIRVLAGMVRQLAEQVERLGELVRGPDASTS